MTELRRELLAELRRIPPKERREAKLRQLELLKELREQVRQAEAGPKEISGDDPLR